MAVYLVDFENVRSEGLRGVENLGKNEKVVIFYSKNADAITFDVHKLLLKSSAEIETFRILRGGRNSLDFQLSTYLGYLVMENCYRKIFIVSQDKGFLCATSFWEENSELCNAKIKMCKSIATAEVEDGTSIDFEDGLTGKFIEKINVKGEVIDEEEPEVFEPTVEAKKKKDNKSKSITKKNDKKNDKKSDKKSEKDSKKNPKKKKSDKNNENVNLNPQNPTSKNKIFSAEIKLNIVDDVKELINGKVEEDCVPFVVESIGLSTGKQHFYRMLVSRFGQDKGQDIYKSIKGQYSNLKRK